MKNQTKLQKRALPGQIIFSGPKTYSTRFPGFPQVPGQLDTLFTDTGNSKIISGRE